MRINEPMPPADIPPAIAAPKKRHRTPVLDDEGNVAEVAAPSDVTRHFAGAHADPIARTLAAVSQPGVHAPRILQGGPLYRVKALDGGWQVVDRDGRRLSEPLRTQSDAVIHAKELAHKAGSAQIIVHAEDGSLSSEFFYQREERSALSSDDSLPSFAATRPAHARRRPAR